MCPLFGEYLLKLIPCRKSNWLHVGSSPTSPTLVYLHYWPELKSGTTKKSMLSTEVAVKPKDTEQHLIALLEDSVYMEMETV